MGSRVTRWGLGALALFAVALIGRPHVRRAAMAAINRSPNHGAPTPALIEGELRVLVASPPASLSLAVMSPAVPRGTVIVLHGIRDRKESMRGFGAMLVASGFRAVLVDLRGHGRSTGDWLSYGVVESRDLVTVVDDLSARHVIVGNVGVLGLSYGAATAIEWASIDPRVKAVVAIAPFTSLRAVVPGYVPVKLPSSFINGCIDDAGQEAGFDPDLASPALAITRSRTPVLLIHGTADDRIPYWHSIELAAAGKGHVELITLAGEGHESIGGDRSGTIRDRGMSWFGDRL